jgi:hypothetical protein
MKTNRTNPINRFFKEKKRLETELNNLAYKSNGFSKTGVWGSLYDDHNHGEGNECKLLKEGIWESSYIRSGREHTKYSIFKIYPNYCTAGRPYYSQEQLNSFYDKSETEKILATEDGYELVWMWDRWEPPTYCYWGFKPSGWGYILRKDGEELARAYTKTDFHRQASPYFGITYKEKVSRKYSKETEKAIRILEAHNGHAAHCEHQVQIFFRPADLDNDFLGWETWKDAVESVTDSINRFVNGCPEMFQDVDLERVKFDHVGAYYRDKLIYNETLTSI